MHISREREGIKNNRQRKFMREKERIGERKSGQEGGIEDAWEERKIKEKNEGVKKEN